MTKFKVGDRVRMLITVGRVNAGDVGIVTTVYDWSPYPYNIRFDSGYETLVGDSDLEAVQVTEPDKSIDPYTVEVIAAKLDALSSANRNSTDTLIHLVHFLDGLYVGATGGTD